MTPLRYFVIALAAGAALAALASDAAAVGGGCSGPHCNQTAYPRLTLFGCNKGNLPAFQAAPWYLYWPYDGHFLTPAPVTRFTGHRPPGISPLTPTSCSRVRRVRLDSRRPAPVMLPPRPMRRSEREGSGQPSTVRCLRVFPCHSSSNPSGSPPRDVYLGETSREG